MSDIIALGDYVSFEERLAETIAWCQPRVSRENINKSLRSTELQPEYLNYPNSNTVRQLVLRRGTRKTDTYIKERVKNNL